MHKRRKIHLGAPTKHLTKRYEATTNSSSSSQETRQVDCICRQPRNIFFLYHMQYLNRFWLWFVIVQWKLLHTHTHTPLHNKNSNNNNQKCINNNKCGESHEGNHSLQEINSYLKAFQLCTVSYMLLASVCNPFWFHKVLVQHIYGLCSLSIFIAFDCWRLIKL